MARSAFSLLFVLVAVAIVSGEVLSPVDYWQTVLPNTPIPSALRQLLPAEGSAAFGSSLWVRVRTPRRGVNVDVSPFLYQYAASKTQVHDNADVALFFLEKDLIPGLKINLHFTKTAPGVPFWPRSVVDSLPFTSAKLSDILSGLSVKPKSQEAAIISKTLQSCETPAVKGETRFCATSLESIVDFVTASLGSRDLLARSTEVSNPDSPKQAYSIAPSGVKKLANREVVACHALSYAYAVYFCHATRATKLYAVSLEGEDGTRVQAAVVCHTDTSKWNPLHIAFQLLKVSPGIVPVCHFLPQDHVVWTSRG